jgi:hypothetical protein
VWERAARPSPLEVVGKVSVELDPKDFDGARTIARDGLCTGQRAQALVAAETLKAYSAGDLTSADVQNEVANIVRVD